MTNEEIIQYWINSSDDDYKEQFRKKTNKDFTQTYIKRIKDFRLWIKSQLERQL